MKLVIGLGNPTAEYANTRHNIGFICLDRWATRHNKSWAHDKEFDYICLRGATLIKPSTYMNRSGVAVKEAFARWKITDTMVIYDDLELSEAVLRVRTGGGDGGHNGMKSLFTVIPPAELKRLRIGIGRGADSDARDYVLDEIPEQDWELFNPVLDLSIKFIDTYIKYDFSQVLNEYSRWKKSYSVAKSDGIISPKEE